MKRFSSLLLLFILFSHVQSHAAEGRMWECLAQLKGHRLLIGPEAYYVYRHRDGGTKQRGWLGGGRFIYEHLRRYNIYWGIEGAMAGGELKGSSSSGSTLKSTMRDRSIEVRFGYTFQFKRGHRFAFTPFIGCGYMIEDNNFKRPTALHLHFKIAYRFLSAGFLSSIYICDSVKVGLNVKVRHLLDPRCKISNDPDFPTTSLKIGNDNLQYRIELPVTYPCGLYSFVATPFYENRIYGGWVGYPFDFMRTRLYNYGLTLQLQLGY